MAVVKVYGGSGGTIHAFLTSALDAVNSCIHKVIVEAPPAPKK